MATTYVKTLITDEATDADSPGTETLFQDLAQSINYVIDSATNQGANSEVLDLGANKIADLDHFESAWTSINDGASNAFAHGLGRTPLLVQIYQSDSSNFTEAAIYGTGTDIADGTGVLPHISVVDGTNVTISNRVGSTQFFKVLAF